MTRLIFLPLMMMTVNQTQALNPDSYDLKENGRSYRIFISAPEQPAPPHGYPVIYMLDGNTMLPLATDFIAKNKALSAVVVGIGYPTDDKKEIIRRRYYDLTPPTPDEFLPDKNNIMETGGREQFFNFIQNSLKPFIESKYSIDADSQALFGHSLGGLFTLSVLYKHADAFQTYVAADPSIWWNNRSILEEQDIFLDEFKDKNLSQRLLIETSGKARNRTGSSSEAISRLNTLRGGPNGRDISDKLSTETTLKVSYHHFSDHTHGSMIPDAVKDALEFILLKQSPLPAKTD